MKNLKSILLKETRKIIKEFLDVDARTIKAKNAIELVDKIMEIMEEEKAQHDLPEILPSLKTVFMHSKTYLQHGESVNDLYTDIANIFLERILGKEEKERILRANPHIKLHDIGAAVAEKFGLGHHSNI